MNKFFIKNEFNREIAEVEAFLVDYLDFPHEKLRESSLHTLKAGGKRIRPAFVLLAGRLFNCKDRKKLISLAASVELIHMSSLIHDDVIDNSKTRRGKPTVKSLWGDNFSLYAGGYLFSRAIKLIAPKENPDIGKVLAYTSSEMAKGELEQIHSLFDVNQTVRDYFYRIKRKTALLISASCEVGAVSCNATKNETRAIKKYGYYLGMAFQIQDDILDIKATSKELGKPAGRDLAQGIMTLPTIYTLRENNSDALFLKEVIINKFSGGKRDIEQALQIIKKGKGLDEAKEISLKYREKAKKELVYLPKGEVKEKMKNLADYIVERNY